MSKSSASRLVYSTESGRQCPACAQPVAQCQCRALAAARPKGDGIARVSRETKGRGGKTVTLIRNLPLDDDALATLGKRLRTACGSGGTVRDGVIEIQGDHRERVIAALVKDGFTVKQAGA
ncbi:MAG: translation initiation factor Sui1 [Rhodocyclaceae bacterium]|nr:translation initiation factor Sui1 [Rhodocyclaceae bacterium]